MKRAKSLSEAVVRLRALVGVLDEELRTFQPPTSLPDPLPEMDASRGAAVRSAVSMLEESLDQLEREEAAARQQATDWAKRAKMAHDEGRIDLTQQALQRAAELEQEAQEYEGEVNAARELLRQWDERRAARGT